MVRKYTISELDEQIRDFLLRARRAGILVTDDTDNPILVVPMNDLSQTLAELKRLGILIPPEISSLV